MFIEIGEKSLRGLTAHQVNNLFFINDAERTILDACVATALQRSEHCFGFSKDKYYRKNDEVYFSPYHSGQYTIYLYFLAREVFLRYPEHRTLADRLYYLNKVLNGLDLFYEIVMPDVFSLDHPVGSVMGRATYGEFFSFCQQCTVGNNKGIYPVIGRNVRLAAGATILGTCKVGDNVIFSANCYVKDIDVPSDCIVFGVSPNVTFKKVG